MIPVTDLEMAANTTFTSFLNEIKLSNLNFTINMTPCAANITLKKTFELQAGNLELKSTIDSLEKNYYDVVHANVSLKESIEEANKVVADLTTTGGDRGSIGV